MGTGAPFPPQVFVLVNSMKTLITVSLRALSAILLSHLLTSQGFNEVHLVLEGNKPPAVQEKELQSIFDRSNHMIVFVCFFTLKPVDTNK